ncbi:MAG: type II secretion system protein [Ramlibacter sp.]|nr:type II secretion system protein [Ramlibacter sp.]
MRSFGHSRTRPLMPGFTLIELLVSMAVLGILAAAIMPLGETLVIAQKERELRKALWEIRVAIDEYKKATDRGAVKVGNGESGYPPSLQTLAEGRPSETPRFPGEMLYFLRQIPRDPFGDPNLPAEATWLMRSYASPPERPEPGIDVYDIRSGSKAVSLDGSAYSTW